MSVDDPYIAESNYPGKLEVVPEGSLFSTDTPAYALLHQGGRVGDSVEWKLQFKEFVRLQIGEEWHLISDFDLWRLELKFRKSAQSGWIADPDPPVMEFNDKGW